MKTVFNSNELSHVWASQQQNEGKAGSFYFRNATIYSYGSHFPIATIIGNDVLFTMRSYSNTTAKHISKAHRAVSHKNIIWCYEVPVDLKYYLEDTHKKNLTQWHKNIASVFAELGNKRIRDVQSRINSINTHIERLNAYCNYFKIKVTDKEFKALLKTIQSDDFLTQARQAKEKQDIAVANKLKLSEKAFNKYITLWRKYDVDSIKEMSDKEKNLANYYSNNQNSFTRLRYNTGENRIETSKGVQIPAEVAKRAFIQLNGCMEGNCKDISVPVLHYTITETTKDYIKAGCHTIPKSDINYIANLLQWK